MALLFADIYQAIAQRPQAADRERLQTLVRQIEGEAAKGEAAFQATKTRPYRLARCGRRVDFSV